jgi:hypothetical protein
VWKTQFSGAAAAGAATAVPEPSSIALVMLAAAGVAGLRRRKA